jgi:concanavalin A-like lectin/glucanase superfamily protein/fibronectin type III domain protein
MIARKSSLLLFVVLVLSLFCIVPLLQAAQVQLSWTAPTTNANGTPLQDLAGYKVYYGTASRSYGTPQDVGNKMTHTLTGLTGGQRYYVAVTAYDTLRNESAYSSEVTFIASLDSGLVAAYGFNEGSGRTVNDASGKGNHGTISGAFWSNSGRYGKALQFDGVNDWVTIKDSASLDLSTGMTLEAWVYPISTPTGWRTLIAKETSGNAVYYLYASSDKNFPLGGGRFGSQYGNLYGVKSLAANTWTHVATTYDTTTQRLFINGSQVAQRSQTGLIAGSSGSLRIGGSSVWGRFFKGRIDEIRIYNRALTAAEITADMNNAVTPASAPAQIATSLLASPDLEALQAALRASGAPSGDTPRLPKSKSSSGDTSSASETMAELLTADHVETAEVFVDHEWKRVAFNKPFVDPIVVAKTISYQGAEPATVRIRAVDATGFEVRLQSWPDADRVHMPEAMGSGH